MKKIQVSNLLKNEQAYQLDTGEIVAISFRPGKHAAYHIFALECVARVINTDGTAITNSYRLPIEIKKHASAPKLSLQQKKTSATEIKEKLLIDIIEAEDGVLAEIASVKGFSEIGL